VEADRTARDRTPDEQEAERPGTSEPGADIGGGPDVYWFVGGPLDGRVQVRPASEPAPATIRHVYLHDSPKIVHEYDLHEVAGHGGEYRLREE
jgi:hypothetical protein